VVLALAIWWVLINLPWLAVGEEEFTGGQLIPVLNLLPAIALTAVFISFYGKLRKILLLLAAAVTGLGVYLSFSQDLETSAVVIAELERLSGVLNPESHEAGVSISQLWGQFAAIGAGIATVFAVVFSLFGSSSKSPASAKSEETEDNRSLWDEQN
jgi:uncharacterized membrane protein